MSLTERAATRVPERIRPLAEKCLYLAHPTMSWRKRRRVEATKRAVVDRFFDDPETFEAYKREFFDGPIVDICRSAAERVPDDRSIYDAHMDECVRLYAIVRERQPRTVFETGVYHGVSTASVLLALAENGKGHLRSLDATPLLDGDARTDGGGDRRIDGDEAVDDETTDGAVLDGAVPDDVVPYFERGRPSCAEPGTHRLAGREPGWILPEDLRDRWDLTVGWSRRDLADLLADGDDLDLFVHDSDHSTAGMLFEFELAWEHLAPGGLLASFHVDHNDAFETFVRERACEHGLLTYTYNGFEDYESPCSSGYAVKPTEN